MKLRIAVISILLCLLAVSCKDRIEPDPIIPPGTITPPVTPPEETPKWPEGQTGKSYIWNESDTPEFHLNFTEKEWNEILSAYDKNSDISAFFRCTAIFEKNGIRDTIKNTGIRLYDNADAMRPEGKSGTDHSKTGTQWNQSNFELNFNRYTSKESNTLRKVKAVYLKSCINDPSYARERYCYDLFNRFGIKTISRNIYCRLNIFVEGDEKPAYIGLYQMIEPIDQTYLEDRAKVFGSTEGNLWKCRNGASLQPLTASTSTGTDEGKGENHQYTLLTNKASIRPALTQLDNFTKKIKTLKNEDFYTWITSVCDVRLLLRTYAVSTAVGMWDDYWNRGTNYYLYFNTTDPENYKVYFIPFDYEMSLGNSRASIMSDPGRQDPYNWGKTANTLMTRLMQNPNLKAIYKEALKELILPEAYLMDFEISSAITSELMYLASFHSKNDTGLNQGTQDKTAPWSNHPEYVMTYPSQSNFFQVRAETINRYSE